MKKNVQLSLPLLPLLLPLLLLLLLSQFTFFACSSKKDNPASGTAPAASTASSGGGSGGGGSSSSDNDPYFKLQWHLVNTGQEEGTINEDINVASVWNEGNRGNGVLVMVVDDGVEIAHPDLVANISTDSKDTHNYVTGSNDPTLPSSKHGTAVAGLIAAKDQNDIGVRGVAPAATLGGNNVLENSTASNIYTALTSNVENISIFNNSWGSDDGYGVFTSANSMVNRAIILGLQTGRNNKGSIYLWPAGNGADSLSADNSNYDGYSIHFGIITVCAVGNTGVRSAYSEIGANVFICAPSSNAGESTAKMVTTDLSGNEKGYNVIQSYSDLDNKDYTKLFGGTSASTPVLSGVVALILNANPNLEWRDVRKILAQSARKNDPTNSDWTTNGAGYHINQNYGFGVVDATAAVALAKRWGSSGQFVSGYNGLSFPSDGKKTVNTAIPDNPLYGSTGLVSSTITVSGSGINKIDYIYIQVNITHADWGDLSIKLKRTINGVTVEDRLAEPHQCYTSTKTSVCSVKSAWTFGSVRHMDEPADGDWTIEVSDLRSGNAGTFNNWQLTLFGG
ncbi:MAG: S8 family serine peptidase [Oligoflexia bacterium]|nr:S8 family serine peptidase [Oligoflexia bacterium]